MAQKPKNEEKFYTAQEVAVAVLKKTHEMLKAAQLAKANTSHEIEPGGEPSNDDAEAPAYLAEADIENSGAHEDRKGGKKQAKPASADKDGDGDVDGADAMVAADKDGDGDIDGADAMEAEEEATGQDLDGDKEAGEAPEHQAKIDAAAKSKPSDDSSKEDKIKAAASGDKKPPFAKSEKVQAELNGKKVNVKFGPSKEPSGPPKDKTEKCGEMRPSLKKFMLQRKMKKAGNSDQQAAAKLADAPPVETPAQQVKKDPKLEMEKNKSVEKLMGIAPKAGK